MAGVLRRSATRRIGALLLVALVWPGTVQAADRDEVIRLPGFTALAHVADLDGDGERELLRLGSDEWSGPFSLEAWSREGSTWRATARLAITGVAGDGAAVPMAADQPATLLPWRDGERERVLLVTSDGLSREGGVDRFQIAVVSRRGMQLELVELPADRGPAERLQAADLDGDGIDELVVTEPGAWQRSIRVLSWSGDRFTTERIEATDGEILDEPIIGETDGVSGDDLIVGRRDRPELLRLTRGSSVTVERAELAVDSPFRPAWPIAVADGAIFVHVESTLVPALLRVEWPAGEEPVISDVQPDEAGIIFPEPLQVGDELVFLDGPWWYGRVSDPLLDVVVRDPTLAAVATVPVSPALDRTHRWREMAGDLRGGVASFPYRGPLPGGIDGSPAFIVGGHLVILRDASTEIRPAASFVGVAPLGLLGPDDAWMALSATGPFSRGPGYVHPFAPVENGVTIAPARTLLEPEANDGALEVTLVGATRVAGPDGEWIASPDGGFEVVVRGAPGSQVAAVIGTRVEASVDIGPEGSAVLELDPRPRRSDTVPYTLGLVLFAPTGHVYGIDWLGRVLREPMSLDVSAETRAGALEATIAGRSDPHASVTVDGMPIAIGADGEFRLTVDAGLVPRDVLVRAVDPIGSEATVRLEVVGVVDYRPWPWPLIVAVATALLTVGMYLRAPRGPGVRVARGDGSIEEIDAG